MAKPDINPTNGINQPVSEKMQTLSAESVPFGCWTALQVRKELAAEIERTQALLEDRKKIALTSLGAVQTKKSVKTERVSGGRNGDIKGTKGV